MRIRSLPLYKKIFLSLAKRMSTSGGNADSETNGERSFIESIGAYYKTRGAPIVVFDAGAHVGNYSALLMETCTKMKIDLSLHAFEPIRKNYDALKSLLKDAPRIVVNNVALSDAGGEVDMYFDREGSTLSSLYKRKLDVDFSQTERIRAVRGEEYISNNSIDHISFLKIDVEGHELAVLAGFGDFLDGTTIDFIQFEYGGTNLDAGTTLHQLYKLLESRGFVIGKLYPTYIELSPYYPSFEDFEYANYIAISKKIINTYAI